MTGIIKAVRGEIRKNNIEAVVIPSKKIVFGRWVRVKCSYGCEMYGRSWSCPPATPDIDEAKKIVSCYKSALFLRFRSRSLLDQKKMQKPILEIERKLFLAGFYKAFAFFPGPCSFCVSCRYPKPCRFPAMKRPTIEGFGIDVFRTAKNAGMDVDVIKNPSGFSHSFSLVLVE